MLKRFIPYLIVSLMTVSFCIQLAGGLGMGSGKWASICTEEWCDICDAERGNEDTQGTEDTSGEFTLPQSLLIPAPHSITVSFYSVPLIKEKGSASSLVQPPELSPATAF